jgi:cysteine desulfurase/selenocysteine lyase
MNDIRKYFPIFGSKPGLVYLDSAATSLSPTPVIRAISEYYESLSANVGRGLYETAERTTTRFEEARKRVARFIGADPREIVFTRNATESLNLVAGTIGSRISEGDNIVVTALEHHSNLLPWKRLALERKAELRVVPFRGDGTVDPETVGKTVDEKTRLVAFSAVSNVFGSANDVEKIVEAVGIAAPNAMTVVDAAQAVGHMIVDVKAWNCDFLAFSGHKAFGPTGIGILFGRYDILSDLPPYQVGGGMVTDSIAPIPEYADAPWRFEAGTPDIAGAFGLDAAIGFIEEIGIGRIREHETRLATLAVGRLRSTFGDTIGMLGPNDRRTSGIVSFSFEDIHPHDVAQVLGERDVCVRAGEHCAAPLHRELGLPATVRASFSVYNTEEDIELLIEGLKEAKRIFEQS